MKIFLNNAKAPVTKYSDRYTASFLINIPAEQIDLRKWIMEMTETDYTSYSSAHIAMNSYFKDTLFFTTNVENIGTDQIVQHYSLQYDSKNHILLHSPMSDVYIMRFIPVAVGVPWEMQIRSLSNDSCEFVCMFGIDFPNKFLQTAYALYSLGGLFLRKHLNKEGIAFSRDIEQKFRAKA